MPVSVATVRAGFVGNVPEGDDRLEIVELPDRGLLAYQVYRQSPAAFARLRRALGFEPPSRPNRASSAEDVHCLWTTPHRWLIDCDIRRSSALLDALGDRDGDNEGDDPGLARPVSCADAFTSVLLRGRDAVGLLARGCALDLRESAAPVGIASRTFFADVPLVIHRSAPTSFRLHVDVSLGHYLGSWLRDAAAGLERAEP